MVKKWVVYSVDEILGFIQRGRIVYVQTVDGIR